MKKIFKKCLAILLIALTVITISFAATNGLNVDAKNNVDASIKKTDYKTTDPKPTYTATLNENNKLLKDLEEKVLGKKKNKALKFAETYGADISDGIFDILYAIKNYDPDEADVEAMVGEFAEKIIVAVAAKYGLGTLAQSIFDGLDKVFSKGDVPLDQFQLLQDALQKEFNKVSDKLYDIEDEIGELSNQITAAVNDILSKTEDQINLLDTKQIIRSFMTGGEGNFSYNRFTNYLYGTSRSSNRIGETYSNSLMEAIVLGAPSEVLKYYYNKLFDSIYNDIPILEEYMLGEASGLDKSIVCYYYDYLNANPKLLKDTTAVSEAISFAFDLYNTYDKAYADLMNCMFYQLGQIAIGKIGQELSDYDYYEYKNGTYMYYKTILEELNAIPTKLEAAKKSAAKDIAYILGLDQSYFVVASNNDIYEIVNDGVNFGCVGNSTTIYANKLPDDLIDMFDLDKESISYCVGGTKQDKIKEGIIETSSITNTTVQVFYDELEIANIELHNVDKTYNSNTTDVRFSGGLGTFDNPYLITNKYQLLKIGEEKNACYEILNDIDMSEKLITPIGSYEKPFNGVVNGNGYRIIDLNVQSEEYDEGNINAIPTTGVFGVIGQYGYIGNIIFDSVSVLSDYKNDGIYPENDSNSYYIGLIAGINMGSIYNCEITSTSTIKVDRLKEVKQSRNVDIYVGGISGYNYGSINFCTINRLDVNVKSVVKSHNESVKINKNTVYIGGIAGTTNGSISNVRVTNGFELTANINTTANTDDLAKPYCNLYAGGIVGNKDSCINYLSNVYADMTVTSLVSIAKNTGSHWFYGSRVSQKNANITYGKYYPYHYWLTDSFGLDDNEMIKFEAEYREELYQVCNLHGISYEEAINENYTSETLETYRIAASCRAKAKLLTTMHEKEEEAIRLLIDKCNDNYDDDSFIPQYDNYLIALSSEYKYAVNEKNLSFDNTVFNINGLTINTEDIDIINYYSFDSMNHEKAEKTSIVKVLFATIFDGKEVVLLGDLEATISENSVVKGPYIEGIVNKFEYNNDETIGMNRIFNQGFDIVWEYADGTKEIVRIDSSNSSLVSIVNFDTTNTSSDGMNYRIIYNEEVIEQTAYVTCNHHSISFVEKVDATCIQFGYDVYTCDLCGEEIHKNFRTGPHNYVVDNGSPATCTEPGHTHSVKCSLCGEVLEESETIQLLPHDYRFITDELITHYYLEGDHSPEDYHYCVNGNHYEVHQYIVIESVDEDGNRVYIYKCQECEYTRPVVDSNLITDEKGDMPCLFVTDGYVKNNGDLVTVYVQILNNPGFNGANFGIRYSEGLELVSYEDGTLMRNTISEKCEVYKGYNFLWAKISGYNCDNDGYLVKLTFRVNSELKETQTVNIVYGDQIVTYESGKTETIEGGFSSDDSNYELQKYMVHSGTISFVDHLPGDVNNDDCVDVFDAIHLAQFIVHKSGVTVRKEYADVNLDKKVDLNDVLAILQYTNGVCGTNLISSKYKLDLNLNGFELDSFPSDIIISLYDENEEVMTWIDNFAFNDYVSYLSKRGYTFVGWFDQLVGGNQIDINGEVQYNNKLGVQTLYAHWKRNSISFVMNGATSQKIDSREYYDDNYMIDFTTPELKYRVNYYVDGSNILYSSNQIDKTFLGWYLGDESISEIDLSTPNLGDVVVEAKWSNYYNWTKPTETRSCYNNIDRWYYDRQFSNDYLITILDDEVVSKMREDNGLLIYGQSNPKEYTIVYENLNGSSASTLSTSITCRENETYNIGNPSSVDNYAFQGWFSNDNPITSISSSNVNNLCDGNNTIVLRAKWKAVPIKVTIEGVDVSSFAGGVYNHNRTLTTLYYCVGADDYGHQEGYYQYENLSGNIVSTLDYSSFYSVFDIKGVYSRILNNGSSNVSVSNATAYFDISGAPTSAKPTSAITLYAMCFPKQYTVTITESRPAYGTTNFNSYTRNIQVYYNESFPNVTMPTNSYYLAKYCYGGTDYYNTEGKSYQIYNNINITTLTIDWTTKIFDEYVYIATSNDFTNNITSENKYFLLINDINFGGITIDPISILNGTLDGDNHCVYNYKIVRTDKTGSDTVGLICTNNGTIKNLKVGNVGSSSFAVDGKYYSVHYNISYKENKNQTTLTVGGIVGTNKGTIQNCQLVNTYISATLADNDNDQHAFLDLGGIAGINSTGGSIRYCNVTNGCYLKGYMTAKSDGGDNNYGRCGGIVAINYAYVYSCYCNSSTLNLDVRGDGKIGNKSYPAGTIGGLVALHSGGTLSDNLSHGNEILVNGSKGTYTESTQYAGTLIGKVDGGSCTECYGITGEVVKKSLSSGTPSENAIVVGTGSSTGCYTESSTILMPDNIQALRN